MAFLTSTANKIIDKILNNTDFSQPTSLYVSLHTADPSGTGANEVTGGSYARQSVSFNSASSKATSNSADIDFAGMPAVTVTHVAIWDASSGGTVWWEGSLTAQKTTESGDTLRIPAGDLDVTLT